MQLALVMDAPRGMSNRVIQHASKQCRLRSCKLLAEKHNCLRIDHQVQTPVRKTHSRDKEERMGARRHAQACTGKGTLHGAHHK